jgi:hypothetical protein
MVQRMSHMLGTQWPGDREGWLTLCAVCTIHVETRSAGFLVEPQNQGGGGFNRLSLKTDSYDLMICALKLQRRIFGLGLKTEQTSVCRLRYKTDERAMAWDTRRDLAACFA